MISRLYKKNKQRFLYGITIAVLIIIPVLSPFFITNSPVIAKKSSEMTADEEWRSLLYLNSLSFCIKNNLLREGVYGSVINESDAAAGNWFTTKSGFRSKTAVPVGYTLGKYLDGNKEFAGCGEDDHSWINDAAALWGYSPVELLCAAGAQRTSGQSDCINGSGKFEGSTGGNNRQLDENKFRQAVIAKVYDGKLPAPSKPARYLRALNAFTNGCLGGNLQQSKSNDAYSYSQVSIVTDGEITKMDLYGTKKRTDRIKFIITNNVNEMSKTCQELATELNNTALAYADNWQPGDEDGTEAGQDDEDTSCQIEGVGWLVCPVTNFLASVSDGAFSIISNFLEVDPELLKSTDPNGTYAAWKSFRSIANIAFVIVFIIVIYSQMTGLGVSNFGIKRLLPRLIVAVILVNLSFFICQIAVDLSNLFGYNIKSFLDSINSGEANPDRASNLALKLLGGGLTVAAVAGGAAIAALAVFGPVLISVVLALLVTLVILIGRMAGIVILTAIAPLAFVAYILPNTENWYKKWFKMYSGLLLVFPIVSLLYGGGQLAARILANTDNTWVEIIAMGVSAIPLILTPSLLKGSMNSLGSIGSKMSGFATARNGAVMKDVKASRAGEVWRGAQKRREQQRIIRRGSQKGIRGKIGGKIDNSRIGKRYGLDRTAARSRSAAMKDLQEDFDNATRAEEAISYHGEEWSLAEENGKNKFTNKFMKASEPQKAAMLQRALNQGVDMTVIEEAINSVIRRKPSDLNQEITNDTVGQALKGTALIGSSGANAIANGDSSETIGELVSSNIKNVVPEKLAKMDTAHIKYQKKIAGDIENDTAKQKAYESIERATNEALNNENIRLSMKDSTRDLLEEQKNIAGGVTQEEAPNSSKDTDRGNSRGTGQSPTLNNSHNFNPQSQRDPNNMPGQGRFTERSPGGLDLPGGTLDIPRDKDKNKP